MPDGTPRKLIAMNRITSLGLRSKIDLEKGISTTYKWLLNSQKSYGKVAL